MEFKRVEYDIDQAIDSMHRAGIEDSVIRQASIVLRSGGNPTAHGL